ncbi:MAG: 1-acyl-sn-glycerol-3-phosphate acyltransferase, partial [Marinobacter sp.]|nr:1-acyl-sn-glycerol-3-phosphate acyltransferase [Marinobacter sp.]
MQEFDAIRPYSDEETAPAIHRLVNDREFLDMVGRFKSPTLSRWTPAMLRVFVRHWLIRQFGQFTRVDDLQAKLSTYVGELVEGTTTRVTHSGLDRLDKRGAYLFISNHRDIVFDPMVVNYLLFQNGFHTTRIAIGDNLLQNRVFAEMMRLNKSFVVRRNITSPREMRDAYLTLSGFINHSIDTNHSIWIAQREGRAKDGIDRTDPAIIKMFYMSRKKSGLGFDEAMNRLHIVPVAISYEYDPCDVDKARELETRARTGTYTKTEGEDSEQIVRGLTGFKGHVHVHFGAPIQDAPNNPKAMSALIDREMHANYHLHASNLVAYQQRGLHPGAH